MSMDTILGAGRGVDPERYSLAGTVPRAALKPATREEVAEALRAASAEKLSVVLWGGGVGLAREASIPRYDIALDLTSLDRVLEYDPEDMTLTAECGVTLERLRETLAAKRQELPLESAKASKATLGGTLAANACGPRRFRFGSPRDRILGMRFALPDGTLARSGGKVVKNVAGYGIHRLLCGSRGALAAILEASLKVLPGPETRVALRFEVPASAIGDEARWATFPRLEPAAVTVLGAVAARALGIETSDDRFQVFVGLEDERGWIARQEEAVRRALGEPTARNEGSDVVTLWQSLADLEARDEPQITFATPRLTPAALGPWLATSRAAQLVFHAPAGRLHVSIPTDETQPTVEHFAAHGFIAIAGVARAAAGLLPQSGVTRLRSALRDSLDPAATLAFGERWMRGG